MFTFTFSHCTISNYDRFPANTYSRSDSLSLDAGNGFSGYAWFTGQTSQTIHVKYTGGYKVTVTNAQGCTASDSLFVQLPGTVGMHVFTVKCICTQMIEVPVKATTFRYMLTMQGTLRWDAKKIELLGVIQMMFSLGTGYRWKGGGQSDALVERPEGGGPESDGRGGMAAASVPEDG